MQRITRTARGFRFTPEYLAACGGPIAAIDAAPASEPETMNAPQFVAVATQRTVGGRERFRTASTHWDWLWSSSVANARIYAPGERPDRSDCELRPLTPRETVALRAVRRARDYDGARLWTFAESQRLARVSRRLCAALAVRN